MSIVALPGFLGLANDWTALIPHANVPEVPVLPFWEAADWLNQWASSLPGPRLLAGYSQGGRLALHAMIRRPDLWDQIVILSAHTGLPDNIQRGSRLREDLLWAERFRQEPWERLMVDWNQRGALSSSTPVIRVEDDYSREQLAQMLDVWSLGRQEDLKPSIEKADVPILWLAGEQDSSFCQIASSLKFKNSASRTATIDACGHRILYDKPHAITKEWPWTLSPHTGRQ